MTRSSSYYYLGDSQVIGWAANQAIGATLPNLNAGIVRSIPILYPPLPIQHKIAAILSAYDDLIEVNTRRIALLEEMARGCIASGSCASGTRITRACLLVAEDGSVITPDRKP